jgi:photosystem II stability/assembly factor-like uncharacterized protein
MKTPILIISTLLFYGSCRFNYLYGQNTLKSMNDKIIAWKEVSQFGAKCFAVNSKGYIFAGNYGVSRSENDGESWVLMHLPNTSYAVNSIAINSKDVIFATTEEGKLYSSINDGNNWTQLFPDSTQIFFKYIAITSSDTLFIGTENGVLRSADNGLSFEKTGFESSVYRIFISPSDDIFIDDHTLYRSVNNGNNWTAVDTGLTNTGINTMAFDSHGQVYAGTAASNGGVFKSLDNCDHWTVTDFSFKEDMDSVVTASACDSADNVIFGTFNLGIFFMKSDGSNLTAINDGIPNPIYDIPFDFINIADNYMLAGFMGAIYKSTQGMPSGIGFNEISQATISLEQNFPNPFNSSTTIQYTLPKLMVAKVSVIDQEGHTIKALIDQYQSQGIHAVTWHADGFYPGVYFYVIEADGYKLTKKMTLLK